MIRRAKKTDATNEPPKEKKRMQLPEDYGKPISLPEIADSYDYDREQENEELLELCKEFLDLEDVDENLIPKIFNEAKHDTKSQIYLNEQINKMADLVGLKDILVFINDMWLEGDEIKSILDVKNNFAIYKEMRDYTNAKQKYQS